MISKVGRVYESASRENSAVLQLRKTFSRPEIQELFWIDFQRSRVDFPVEILGRRRAPSLPPIRSPGVSPTFAPFFLPDLNSTRVEWASQLQSCKCPSVALDFFAATKPGIKTIISRHNLRLPHPFTLQIHDLIPNPWPFRLPSIEQVRVC